MTLKDALEAVQKNVQWQTKQPSEQFAEAKRMIGQQDGGGGGTFNYVPGKGLVPNK